MSKRWPRKVSSPCRHLGSTFDICQVTPICQPGQLSNVAGAGGATIRNTSDPSHSRPDFSVWPTDGFCYTLLHHDSRKKSWMDTANKKKSKQFSIERCSSRWSEDRQKTVVAMIITKSMRVSSLLQARSERTYLGRIHSHFWSTLYFRIACLDVFSPPSDISIVWPTPSVKDGALLRWRNLTIVPEFSTKPLHSPVISLLNNVQYVTG